MPFKQKNSCKMLNFAGIGDDLFEAFFADDEPKPPKKKPAPTTAAPVTVKPAAKKPPPKRKAPAKKTATKKTPAVAAKPIESEKEKPQFQHTPALLELAQQNDDKAETPVKIEDSSQKVTLDSDI